MINNKSSYMIKSSSKLVGSLFVSVMLFLLLSSAASALNVTNAPEEVVYIGNTVTFSGNAITDVNITTMFTATADVVDGEYEYVQEEVTLPSGADYFSVRAETVDTLNITVTKDIFGIPVSYPFSASVNNGVASFSISQEIPVPLTCKVAMSGESDSDSVNIAIRVDSTIETKNDGSFECSYDTSALPAGEFIIVMEDGSDSKQYNLTLSTKPPIRKKASSGDTGNQFNVRTEAQVDNSKDDGDNSKDDGGNSKDDGDNSGGAGNNGDSFASPDEILSENTTELQGNAGGTVIGGIINIAERIVDKAKNTFGAFTKFIFKIIP